MRKSYKEIVSALLILMLVLSAGAVGICGVSAEEDDYGCRAAFEEFFIEEMGSADEESFWDTYVTTEYYSELTDPATPDFILVECFSGADFSVTGVILGGYVVRTATEASPYPLGIYVYTPKDGEIYNLSQAYKKGIKGVKEMIESYDIEGVNIRRIGDVDEDKRITIKDATLIQKMLAKSAKLENDSIPGVVMKEEYNTEFCFYYSDFNHDGVRNIKDATAIQKYLAKI